jgi:3-oxoacyl-(acyl-carrier-protein) synthase III
LNITGVRIAGVGHFVPEQVLTNADLERLLDTSDDWIMSRTGMKERHVARLDEPTSDIALAAAKNALAQAHLEPRDVNCIIVATVTPDYAFPATACVVGSKLGIAGVPAFDMEIGCSGFIYGLTVAASLVRAGIFKRVLLIGAEELTRPRSCSATARGPSCSRRPNTTPIWVPSSAPTVRRRRTSTCRSAAPRSRRRPPTTWPRSATRFR